MVCVPLDLDLSTAVLSCLLSPLLISPFSLFPSLYFFRETLETYFNFSCSFSLIWLIVPHLHVFLPLSPFLIPLLFP